MRYSNNWHQSASVTHIDGIWQTHARLRISNVSNSNVRGHPLSQTGVGAEITSQSVTETHPNIGVFDSIFPPIAIILC